MTIFTGPASVALCSNIRRYVRTSQQDADLSVCILKKYNVTICLKILVNLENLGLGMDC